MLYKRKLSFPEFLSIVPFQGDCVIQGFPLGKDATDWATLPCRGCASAENDWEEHHRGLEKWLETQVLSTETFRAFEFRTRTSLQVVYLFYARS